MKIYYYFDHECMRGVLYRMTTPNPSIGANYDVFVDDNHWESNRNFLVEYPDAWLPISENRAKMRYPLAFPIDNG